MMMMTTTPPSPPPPWSPWELIEDYFRTTPDFTTQHHLDSYDHFVRVQLRAIFRSVPIEITRNTAAGRPLLRVQVNVGGASGDAVRLGSPVLAEADGRVRPMYPNDARVMDLTYAADVVADVDVSVVSLREGATVSTAPTVRRFRDVRIGAIPIMHGSCLCVLGGMPPEVRLEMGESVQDRGGYFIVRGREKMMIPEEVLATNRLFVIQERSPELKGYSHTGFLVGRTELDTFEMPVRFRVVHAAAAGHQRHRAVEVHLKDIKSATGVPLFTMFRALGVESDRRILQHVLGGDPEDPSVDAALLDFLMPSLWEGRGVQTQAQALAQIAGSVYYGADHARKVVADKFMRGAGNDQRKKALLMGRIVAQVGLTVLGRRLPTARDNFLNKRVLTSGAMLADLFRDVYNDHYRKAVQARLEAIFASVGSLEEAAGLVAADDLGGATAGSRLGLALAGGGMVEELLEKSLRGSWRGEDEPAEKGRVQQLNRLSYIGTLSMARRIASNYSAELNLAGPRRLLTSQWGVVCPLQSPDGAKIGLDKHLASMTLVSVEGDPAPLRRLLLSTQGTVPLEEAGLVQAQRGGLVFLNSDPLGVHPDLTALAATMRDARRRGAVHPHASVVHHRSDRELHVFCDGGRLLRPLLVVAAGWRERLGQLRTWAVAERTGALEWVDVEEMEGCLVAMWPRDAVEGRHTHCELHPSTCLSLYSNSIPFVQHSQAVRSVFSAAQGKQAIGVFATNYANRMDTTAYVLHSPQAPLVTTRYNRFTGCDALPNGENLVVALLVHGGHSIEDAVIFSEGAARRGCLNVTVYSTLTDAERRSEDGRVRVVFGNPEALRERGVTVAATERQRTAGHAKVDGAGMPLPDAFVSQGDVLVGKVCVTRGSGGGAAQHSDASRPVDKTIEGRVDRVLLHSPSPGARQLKVRLRQVRPPTLGDKVATRHGQKGVVGRLLREEDMPFTAAGVVPDVLVNPHSFPSRMTVSQMLEMVLAKTCVWTGVRGDATAFTETDTEGLFGALADAGGGGAQHRHGEEVMYDGRTGAMLGTTVFLGPCFYSRLKHMAADKINYRGSEGKRDPATRQPMRGRRVDGGLKLGEMEADVLRCQGAMGFLHEAFSAKSDATVAMLEETRVVIPYSLRCLVQEAGALGVGMKLVTGGDEASGKRDLGVGGAEAEAEAGVSGGLDAISEDEEEQDDA
jgi:DNA-directed RNA polymerase II subunit RPB2